MNSRPATATEEENSSSNQVSNSKNDKNGSQRQQNDRDDEDDEMDTSLSSVNLDSAATAALLSPQKSPPPHRQQCSRRLFSLRRGRQRERPSNPSQQQPQPSPPQNLEVHSPPPAQQQQQQKKQRFKKLASGAKNVVDKINIGKWIDNLEKDQELADHLEIVNHEYQQESSHKILVGHVREQCMDEIRRHLEQFWEENQHHRHDFSAPPTYDDWIRELHPDNVQADGTMDARFYIPDCDHWVLWNQYQPPPPPPPPNTTTTT
jgi:hypothetical protein